VPGPDNDDVEVLHVRFPHDSGARPETHGCMDGTPGSVPRLWADVRGE
jgi:hypothetical protein